jgi:hypothetical protein
VPAAVATGVTARSDLVEQGQVPTAGGATWHAAVTAASDHAFLSGLRLAMIVGAAVTLVGTLCGPFVRATLVDTDRPSTPIHF